MSLLDRKLLRDLARLKGQALTVALVVASGVTSYVCLQGTWASLERARIAYYERYRFADLFVHLRRAPESVRERLEELDGVTVVETRLVEEVTVPLDDLEEPATGRLVSLPSSGEPARLDDIAIVEGRRVDPGRTDEIVVLESFATAHDLHPGDRLPVVLAGTLRRPRIVGVALCPEYVFPSTTAALYTDDARFAVVWMDERAVAPAFEMEGAFDDVLVSLQPGASERALADALDRTLEPYGGLGTITRARQPSNFALAGEMAGLREWAALTPIIFLLIAAFLLNVVLSRLVALQRTQIAMLRALGIGKLAIAAHYTKLVTVIVLAGAAIGIGVGAWLGSEMTQMYTRYFKFPDLHYILDWRTLVIATATSLAAALAGALLSALRVARMAPADAMRPPAPARYRRSILDRLTRVAGISGRMVARELQRRPLRFSLSVTGVAFAIALVVLGRFTNDAFEALARVQFEEAMREDLAVSFRDPVSERSALELGRIEGVRRAEAMLVLPVRFRAGARFRDAVLHGYEDDGELRRVVDTAGGVHAPPADGILLTSKLAEVLGLHVGDQVRVDVHAGAWPRTSMRVAGLVDEPMGLAGHARAEVLWRALREPPSVNVALLRIDPRLEGRVHHRLREMPAVSSVMSRSDTLAQFRRQSADWMAVMSLVLTLLATIVTIAVIYNGARVALSVRRRDFASLRVLGFTRAEISGVLLSEIGLQTALAIPLGLYLGKWLCGVMMSFFDPEQYRLPMEITPASFAFAAAVTIVAALLSGLLVRRRVDHLDLIGVLKTRD